MMSAGCAIPGTISLSREEIAAFELRRVAYQCLDSSLTKTRIGQPAHGLMLGGLINPRSAFPSSVQDNLHAIAALNRLVSSLARMNSLWFMLLRLWLHVWILGDCKDLQDPLPDCGSSGSSESTSMRHQTQSPKS
jgi:hypothetical protein